MRNKPHVTSVVLIFMLAVFGLAACAGKSSARQPDDLTITARVKTALLNDPDIVAPRIDVETANGVVTLSDRVASKQEEEKAIRVARAIAGVVDVKSTLQIQQ